MSTKTVKIELTKAELRALFDAASQMSDDFIDYYSFMGPKRALKHAGNYASALKKIQAKM